MISKIHEFARELKRASKRIIKYVGILILILYTLAVVTYLLAGRGIDYYVALDISQQLMKCINPCIWIAGLGILFFEVS